MSEPNDTDAEQLDEQRHDMPAGPDYWADFTAEPARYERRGNEWWGAEE